MIAPARQLSVVARARLKAERIGQANLVVFTYLRELAAEGLRLTGTEQGKLDGLISAYRTKGYWSEAQRAWL